MLILGARTALLAMAAALIALAGCGQSADGQAPANESAETAPTKAPPAAPDPGAAATGAAAPVATTPIQPAAPGVWTSGDLTIRSETANLRIEREGSRQLLLGMTVTFENASAGPISIAIAEDGWPSIQLDNGLNMQPDNPYGITVLRACSRPMAECRQAQRDRFAEIESGRSLSVTMTFEGYFPEGGREDAQTVDSGTVGMRLHLLEGDGLQRTLDVSLKDAPLTNRIG